MGNTQDGSTGPLAVDNEQDGALKRLTALAKRSMPHVRLLAPPVVGALLISPFVLATRLWRWMTPDPFFAYIHFFLFFFPSPLAAGAYLERSVITLFFVAAGTGLTFLAICGCIWIDGGNSPAYSTQQSRAIGVCTLLLLCFASGALSSYAPRLKGPCRALIFAVVWELTKQYNTITARIFLDQFYPAMIAMIVGIVCNFAVFPRTARRTSIGQLCELLDGTQRLMAQAVEDFFVDLAPKDESQEDAPHDHALPTASLPKFRKLKAGIESLQNRLEANLDAASYEVALARVPIEHLQSLLPLLRNIRAWVSCSLACLADKKFGDEPLPTTTGSIVHDRVPSEPAFDFQQEIRSFSGEISASLGCMRQCVKLCMGSDLSKVTYSADVQNDVELQKPAGGDIPVHDPVLALTQQKDKLRASIRTFKAALSDAIKESRSEVLPAESAAGIGIAVSGQSSPSMIAPLALGNVFRSEAYAVSFLMISLLEVALLVDSCLKIALVVANTWQAHPHRSLRMPAAKWRYWLGVGALEGASDEMAPVDALLHEDDPPESPTSDVEGYEEMDFFDHAGSEVVLASKNAPKLERTPSRVSHTVASLYSWTTHKVRSFRMLFRSRTALQYRITLSNRIRTLRHSRHIKFGFKLSAGIVLLTLPAWLAPGGSKQWWLDQRGQWMAISYLFCLETSTGASIRTSLFRILGTISGSLLGLIAHEISRGNAYALAFLLTVATVPPSYLMLFTRFQGVGIVMGLTLPIVAVIPTEDSTESAVYVAWNRGYMIFFGIVAALVVNLFFWPLHARLQLVARVSAIASQLQALYLSLSRQMLSGGLTASHKSSVAFEKLEMSIEKRIRQARGLFDIMTAEVSLKPKRTKVLKELLDHLEMVLELLMGLRRCREHGLKSVRQHAVVNVLELRQSLIASVLLVLWTTGQALQTKAPLPQCLPSPQLALEELTEAVAEQLRLMAEDGVESSHRPHHPHRRAGVPDAFHALDSLNKTSILASVRKRHRKRPGLHSIQTGGNGSSSVSVGTLTPARRGAGASEIDTPATTRKKSLDYAMFFILAEHALLEEIVTSLERLLELCRSMVGEASFLRTEFVPDHQLPPGTPGKQPVMSLGESGAHLVPSQPPRSTARSHSSPDIRRARDASPSPLNRPVHPSPLAG